MIWLWLLFYFCGAMGTSVLAGWLFGRDVLKFEFKSYTGLGKYELVRHRNSESWAVGWMSLSWPLSLPVLVVCLIGVQVRQRTEKLLATRREQEVELQQILRSEGL